MTDPSAESPGRDVDARRASDGADDTEGDRVREADPNAGAQHASADVAPELFGW